MQNLSCGTQKYFKKLHAKICNFEHFKPSTINISTIKIARVVRYPATVVHTAEHDIHVHQAPWTWECKALSPISYSLFRKSCSTEIDVFEDKILHANAKDLHIFLFLCQTYGGQPQQLAYSRDQTQAKWNLRTRER